jgi:hypothetical protein
MLETRGKILNMNIAAELFERIERYGHRRMFTTRSESMEFLLQAALKLNPQRQKTGAVKAE